MDFHIVCGLLLFVLKTIVGKVQKAKYLISTYIWTELSRDTEIKIDRPPLHFALGSNYLQGGVACKKEKHSTCHETLPK